MKILFLSMLGSFLFFMALCRASAIREKTVLELWKERQKEDLTEEKELNK